MKKALIIGSGLLTAFALPLVSLAAGEITTVQGVSGFIIGIINMVLVPLLFAVAFIVFLWGAFSTFILGANSEEVKEKGKNLMLWGLIGFFVMVSLWGLVNILTNTAPTDNTGPKLPGALGGSTNP